MSSVTSASPLSEVVSASPSSSSPSMSLDCAVHKTLDMPRLWWAGDVYLLRIARRISESSSSESEKILRHLEPSRATFRASFIGEGIEFLIAICAQRVASWKPRPAFTKKVRIVSTSRAIGSESVCKIRSIVRDTRELFNVFPDSHRA